MFWGAEPGTPPPMHDPYFVYVRGIGFMGDSAQALINNQISSPWIGTIPFSKWMKMHPQTVRAHRKKEDSPWRQGIHYRPTGVTGRGPMQWHRDLAEKAYNEHVQIKAEQVETFSRATHPTQH